MAMDRKVILELISQANNDEKNDILNQIMKKVFNLIVKGDDDYLLFKPEHVETYYSCNQCGKQYKVLGLLEVA